MIFSNKFKNKHHNLLIAILTCLILILTGTIICNIYILQFSKAFVYTDSNAIPNKDTILVLGAGVKKTEMTKSAQLRVEAGCILKEQNKAPILVLSGFDDNKKQNELPPMYQYVYTKHPNIPINTIATNNVSFNTLQSMKELKKEFPNQSTIIVTQNYHIYRALFYAHTLGIDSVGYSLPLTELPWYTRIYSNLREFLARVKAVLVVVF